MSQALMDAWIPGTAGNKSQLIHYENDGTMDMDQLKNKLVDLGYERVGQVQNAGTVFQSRWYCGYLLPHRGKSRRIELWG